MIIFITALIIS